MSEELKPCPLCKSKRIGGAIDTVTCWDCGLTLRRPRPLANAVAAWNARPAPAVQVPDVTPELAAFAWQLAFKEGDTSGVDMSLRVARHVRALLLAAAPAATVATEAVAQSTVPESQYVALLEQYRDLQRAKEYCCCGECPPREPVAQGGGVDAAEAFELGFRWRAALDGHVHDARDVGRTLICDFWPESIRSARIQPDMTATKEAAIVAVKAAIRALLTAAPAGVGGNTAEICHNCDSPLPEGCGGVFKRDGDSCPLNKETDQK